MEKYGTINDRYRVIRKIGSGGMSEVYLVSDIKLEKTWAMKAVCKAGKEGLLIERLRYEVDHIKRFDHRMLPRIVDVYENDSFLYIIMDYIEGKVLEELVCQKGGFDEKLAVEWGIQLCDVLCYLHEMNPAVIYGDMKPSNIMLKRDGALVLIDFGISRCESAEEHFTIDTNGSCNAELAKSGQCI